MNSSFYILTSLTVAILPNTLKAAVSQTKSPKRCAWNEFQVVTGSKVFCRACPKCPVGQGLSPQCGSSIKADEIIRCADCQEGLTFSDTHDLMACKPCSICDSHEETLQNCTLTRNSKCGKCHRGYYRAITDDCHKCSWCCPDSKDQDIQDQCVNQGLPRKQSCRDDYKTRNCGPKTASITQVTTVTIPHSDKDKRPGQVKAYVWLVAAVAVFVVTLTICIVTVLWVRRQKLFYQRIQHEGKSVDGQGRPNTFLLNNNSDYKNTAKV